MKEKLKECIESKVKIIAELPSMQGHHNPNYTLNEIRNPYAMHTLLDKSISCNINQINEDITECCVKTFNLLKESYQLNRKKAGEILIFLLSDSDREKKHTQDS